MRRSAVIISAFLLLFALPHPVAYAATTVVPNVHRSIDEGYFSVVLQLPKDRPAGRIAIYAKPVEGDIFMVSASPPAKEDSQEITLTGRYGRPGKATVAIMAKAGLDPGEEFKQLFSVTMDLPDTVVTDLDVKKTWGTFQRRRLTAAGYGGGDSFLTYWNNAAARRYGLGASEERNRFEGPESDVPDIYGIFTGAAAIQESLQLDVLSGQGRRAATAAQKASSPMEVPMSLIPGPTVKSHPFEKMLKDRSPKLPALAALIPADQYAVFFTDINKQIELADLMEDWGGSLLETLQTSSRDFRVRQQITRQLCLETNFLTRLFADKVIGAMAITGNDPFLKEGSDVTILFSLKKKDLFLQNIEQRYTEAVTTHKARRDKFSSSGKEHIMVTTQDRTISSYTVILGDIGVVSNSLEGLRRVLEIIPGKIPSLAASRDFQYMRTIFTEGDENEDIFIYLSDPFIRKLVGPAVKINEARRMTCAANLQILTNARFWFKAERRREPTMKDLKDGGYLGEAQLECPSSGGYAFDRNTGEPVCNVHNRIGHLTPLVAIAPGPATAREVEQYKAFVENYNRYWTRFFDPIGIRVKLGESVRIQTVILPLIENSWYDGLAAFSGRKEGTLAEASVLPRTIVSLRGRMAPEWLNSLDYVRNLKSRGYLTSWIGDELSLNLCDGPVLFTVEGRAAGILGQEMGRASLEPIMAGYLLSAINLPTYLSVKVTDTKQAELMVPRLFQSLMSEHASREFKSESYALEQYKGKNITVFSFSLFIVKLRLYASVIGDRLVLASRRDIVTDLIDAASGSEATASGNLEFSIYRTGFKQIEPFVGIGYQEDIRHACQKNLALAELLLETGGVKPEDMKTVAFGLRGYEPFCPSGGKYYLDPQNNRAACTLHGKNYRQTQPIASAADAPSIRTINSLKKINARLTFTPEGLMTTVELSRVPGGEGKKETKERKSLWQ